MQLDKKKKRNFKMRKEVKLFVDDATVYIKYPSKLTKSYFNKRI